MSNTEPTVDELAERVRELEQQQVRIPSPQEVKKYVEQLPITRRQLGMAIGAGMVSVPALMADIASAQNNEPGAACTWRGDQNAAGYSLFGLGKLHFADGSSATSVSEFGRLAAAGYDSGDFLPLMSFAAEGAVLSTASSTFSNIGNNIMDLRIHWDDVFQGSVTTVGYSVANLDANNDQIDFRVQNVVDNETVVETTGHTGGPTDFSVGPTDYTPATTAGFTEYFMQARNSDGATSVEVRDPAVWLGIRL